MNNPEQSIDERFESALMRLNAHVPTPRHGSSDQNGYVVHDRDWSDDVAVVLDYVLDR